MIATHQNIQLRKTTNQDVDWITSVEKENAPLIEQWTNKRHATALKDSDTLHLIINDEKSPHNPKGYIILTGINDIDDSILLRRIVVKEKSRGTGTKAIEAVMDHVFNTLKKHRLWLCVLDTNYRAQKLYITRGFVKEGIWREAAKQSNGTYNSYIAMSMLDHEHSSRLAPQK